MTALCNFEFERPNPIYYSGETITGRVILRTTQPMRVNSVNLCTAHRQGKSALDGVKVSHKKRHKFTIQRILSNSIHSRSEVFGEGLLPTGTHSYNIQQLLPSGCASSCEESSGHINYIVSLTVDRHLHSASVFRQPLTVFRKLDLNSAEHSFVSSPLHAELIQSFCYWPCSSGANFVELTIPHGGYAPGQALKYHLVVNNQTRGTHNIEGIVLKLLQVYNFSAQLIQQRNREHTNVTSCIEHCGSFSTQTETEIEGILLIPPMVPPTCETDSIITVRYCLEVSVKNVCNNLQDKITLPLVIGTVPLRTNPGISVVWAPATALTTIPAETDDFDDVAQDKPPLYELCLPPTYAEATYNASIASLLGKT